MGECEFTLGHRELEVPRRFPEGRTEAAEAWRGWERGVPSHGDWEGSRPGHPVEEGAGNAAPGGPFNRGRAPAGPRALAAVAGPEWEPERSPSWGRSGWNGAPARARSAPPAAAAAATPAAATAPPRPRQVCEGQPQFQGGERAGPSPATRQALEGREGGEWAGAAPPPAASPGRSLSAARGLGWGVGRHSAGLGLG